MTIVALQRASQEVHRCLGSSLERGDHNVGMNQPERVELGVPGFPSLVLYREA